MKLGTITIMILLKNLCDYDYDYDYSKMCNRLQSITIIIVIRPNPALYRVSSSPPLVGTRGREREKGGRKGRRKREKEKERERENKIEKDWTV